MTVRVRASMTGGEILGVWLAPRPGFEPGLEDSKSSVLPLDDLGMQGLRFKDILVFRILKGLSWFYIILKKSIY